MLYEHTMQRYFEPLFIGIPVEQIPFSSWLEWFDKIGKKKPKNAGHLLRRLKSMLSFCIRRNLIGGSPVLQLRTEDVGSQPERGTRVLTMRELAQIWIAFEQSRASRGLKLAAKLVILLGCRSGEALGAQWSEFNMEGANLDGSRCSRQMWGANTSAYSQQGYDAAARSGSERSAKGRASMSLASESEKIVEQCVPDPVSRACAR